MRFNISTLVFSLLYLSTLTFSLPIACPSRDVCKRNEDGTCIIDLRSHPLTKALGGSDQAHFSTYSSECRHLHQLIGKSIKLWRAGNRNESIALFFQVYHPQADLKEMRMVQEWLNPNLSSQFKKKWFGPGTGVLANATRTESNSLLNGSAIPNLHEVGCGGQLLVKRVLSWSSFKNLAQRISVGEWVKWATTFPYKTDFQKRAKNYLALIVPGWYSVQGNSCLRGVLEGEGEYVGSLAWDEWEKKEVVCLGNQPKGCEEAGLRKRGLQICRED